MGSGGSSSSWLLCPRAGWQPTKRDFGSLCRMGSRTGLTTGDIEYVRDGGRRTEKLAAAANLLQLIGSKVPVRWLGGDEARPREALFRTAERASKEGGVEGRRNENDGHGVDKRSGGKDELLVRAAPGVRGVKTEVAGARKNDDGSHMDDNRMVRRCLIGMVKPMTMMGEQSGGRERNGMREELEIRHKILNGAKIGNVFGWE
ncbi:hypothetical protein R3P38DRAFT_2788162 [Favolaschia claudopus]|uniref:Uncharacterized protein n=1 Tax=Favolaschia claudopus TaxID=2862362 RepID=A0AAW0AL40_9AGAR